MSTDRRTPGPTLLTLKECSYATGCLLPSHLLRPRNLRAKLTTYRFRYAGFRRTALEIRISTHHRKAQAVPRCYNACALSFTPCHRLRLRGIQHPHSVYLYVCLSHCRTTRSAIGCQVPTTLLRPNACAYGIATTLLPVPQVSIGQYSRYGFNTMEHLDGPQAYLQLPAFCPAISLPCSRKTLLQGQTDQKTAVGVSNRVH